MRCLVTGVAGFIGSTLAERLIDLGHEVTGVDRFADYYPRPIKERNLLRLRDEKRFHFVEADLARVELAPLVEGQEVVWHQAAQAGVRASWGDTFATYVDDNVLATQRLLEAAKAAKVRKVVAASSSSVYGENAEMPMRETNRPQPFSPYGVTKMACEHLCELYRANFGLPTASLRYFTVYGPRQRPDMGFNKFIAAAFAGKPIQVFGDGEQTRDFTFIQDAVDANLACAADGVDGVFNVGGGSRVTLNEVLATLAELVGPLKLDRIGEQAGDVRHTWADTSRAQKAFGYAPKVALREGLAAQVEWQRALLAR